MWPGFGDDTARWVRRVWAVWRKVSDKEIEAGLGEFVEAGRLRWVQYTEPGDGLRPVTVVTLGGQPPGSADG